MEYVASAKRAGIYSYLLNYIAIVHSGENPPFLPGEQHILQQGSHQAPTSAVPRSLQSNFHHSGTRCYTPFPYECPNRIILHTTSTNS